MIYIYILAILILVSVFNILTTDKYSSRTNILFYIICIVIFILAAFRDGIGYDFNSYKEWYDMIHNQMVSSNYLNVEKGYFLLNKIAPNFEILIFITAILGVGIKIFFINKYSQDKIISLIMYFTGVFMMFDIGAIRQGIAISICLISIPYIINRDLYKFLFTILIASLFHITSIVFIPLYFMRDNNYTKKQMYYISIFVLIFSFVGIDRAILKIITNLNIPLISSKIAYYLTYNTGNITLSLIKRIIFLFIFIEIIDRKKIKLDSFSTICLNGYFLSIIIMGLFSSVGIIGGRGSLGLYFLQIFIFAILFKNMSFIASKLIFLVLIILLSLNSMIDLIKDGNNSNQPYTPYKSIININS